MSDRYDVAIIGGGVVGVSIAFAMRALGSRLAVIDGPGAVRPASRANFGLVWVQGKGEHDPAYAAWTLASARAWPQLAADLREATGLDVALRQAGGVHVCLSREAYAARAALVERLRARGDGAQVEMRDRAALLARLPGLGPAVVGGSFCVDDGDCNPLRLLRAFDAALAAAGVARRGGARVETIEPRSGGFRIVTAAGAVEAERVVLAAGLDTARLAPMVGLAVPLAASKGHVIALGRVAPMLPLPLETLRQTDDGIVLVGDSHEDRDDDVLDPAVIGAIARRAMRILPALASARVIRSWAGLRVMTLDGLPLYDASRTHPGAFAVACHSGVTLAAAHAFTLGPAIADGRLPDALAPFGAARFGHVRAAA
jgi:glycine/D-amino acid oxidase-like deaminating enzyme